MIRARPIGTLQGGTIGIAGADTDAKQLRPELGMQHAIGKRFFSGKVYCSFQQAIPPTFVSSHTHRHDIQHMLPFPSR